MLDVFISAIFASIATGSLSVRVQTWNWTRDEAEAEDGPGSRLIERLEAEVKPQLEVKDEQNLMLSLRGSHTLQCGCNVH